MARIRTVKPSFWDNVGLSKLSNNARLLYIGMWNFADDMGVIPGSTLGVKSRVFPYAVVDLEEVDKWLEELIKHKFILQLYYQDERYFYMDYFMHNQLIKKPNYTDTCIPKELLINMLEEKIRTGELNSESIPNQFSTIKDSIGKESIGEDSIGKEGKVKKENIFSFLSSSEKNKNKCSDETAFDKFNNWMNLYTPYIRQIPQQITEEQFNKMCSKYSTGQIVEILTQMDNYKEAIFKYTNVYRTFLNWAKKVYG